MKSMAWRNCVIRHVFYISRWVVSIFRNKNNSSDLRVHLPELLQEHTSTKSIILLHNRSHYTVFE